MKCLIMIAGMLLIGGASFAQAQKDSIKQAQKIEQLFSLINMEEACLQAANTSADQTIANTPQLAGRKEEARAFFIKYMGYEACRNDLIKLYAKHYTPEEIDELIRFHKTSAGKKSTSVAALIQQESLTMLTGKLNEHSAELAALTKDATQQ